MPMVPDYKSSQIFYMLVPHEQKTSIAKEEEKNIEHVDRFGRGESNSDP
jgi:hypothetical protein